MRTVVAWADRVHDRDGVKQCIYDMCFKPDGTQLVVAAGQRVMVYDTTDGDLIQALKGHKGTVYCVTYSTDGKRFASGGADNTIIIWTNKLDGILKYSHGEPITALQYNPVTMQLASCTQSDFGLWFPDQKSVQKHRVNSKVLCCSWTNDGQYIALGHFNGNISIRDKEGMEKVKIERNGPVWTLAWNPSKDEPYDILAAGDWDGKMSFYQLSGRQVTKDKDLGFDPCSLTYFSNGEYLCVGGSDKKVTLWTKEGVKLQVIGEREDWVWVCRAKPKQTYVAVGCNDGTIAVFQLVFSTVHGLYQDRYAYRDFMTDVIIQHLSNEQKVRIKCRDYVKKIAIYKERLAVQLPNQIVVYELMYNEDGSTSTTSTRTGDNATASDEEIHYKAKWRIQKKLECNLLVVTSMHIILCQEKKLQLYDLKGNKEREWVLESLIRYIKVVGGPKGREGLLVGLKNGQILKIFITNPFPIPLIKQKTSVRCLDLSASRKKLAVVDENNQCLVYDLTTKELLFTEPNANSACWNTELEDLLCFSGSGVLNIKAGKFPVHQQKLQGFVVGFKGSRIFCLHVYAMQAIDVPQSASLYRYLERGDYESAYRIACLGVTDQDWRLLAIEAIQGLHLDIARKAFIRVRDMRYIDLIKRIEATSKSQNDKNGKSGVVKLSDNDRRMFLADILAYQGKYLDAAKMFIEVGQIEKAIEMFADLRLWDEAKKFAQSTDKVNIMDLIRSQARWAEEAHEWKAAADMYKESGDFIKAVEILGERGWIDDLMDLVRTLRSTELPPLIKAVEYFKKHQSVSHAIETYQKMGDFHGLMVMLVEQLRWEEGLQLLTTQPELASEFYLPYAHWLAINDRFEEAQSAFKKAGRPEESVKVLEDLTQNAVIESRFDDASFYYWMLAGEYLRIVQTGISQNSNNSPLKNMSKNYLITLFYHYRTLADIYYAYYFIYRYTIDPFTIQPSENIFNISRFLLNTLSTYSVPPPATNPNNESDVIVGAIRGETPIGVSRINILYALGKQSRDLEAYKVARFAYEKLQALRIPPAVSDQLDLLTMSIRAKPYSDKEDLQPICYRCSFTNPLLTTVGSVNSNDNNTAFYHSGGRCTNCIHNFVYSFYSFDVLPLVQFELDDDITDEDAEKLIEMEPRKSGVTASPFKETAINNTVVQTLSLEGDNREDDFEMDLFSQLLEQYEQMESGVNVPLKVSREILHSLHQSEVFIRKYEGGVIRPEYFKNMEPDIPIVMCAHCGKFFLEDDYEVASMQKNFCPYCRAR